ncbi:unnamed protein product [Tuber aestivum]|uniref:Zn(2)-C6 fungal-type domain-containing protein n=1 Tax=Tuber aestivum TaxID=59557 RepID=A0A292Q1G2_9PEZI|nr:unnamed protein product [Tuber aestivum]
MVGVPGRSKGCNTCRKRKIGVSHLSSQFMHLIHEPRLLEWKVAKCDQKRPECGNCIKSNRVCAGYHRAVVFRNATGPGLSTHAAKASVPPDPKTGSSGDGGSANSGTAKDAVIRLPPRSVKEAHFPLLATPPPQPHHRSAFVAHFLDWYTPASSQLGGIPSGWVHSIPFSLNCGVRVFDTAIMAMCTVFVGRWSKDERLVQESTRIYTIALAELSATLSSREVSIRDETLAATMSLAMFETMGCTEPSGWQRHADGMALLVRLRGPEVHKTGLAHFLFSSFLSVNLINSLIIRRRSFLASEEWRTIPWTNVRRVPVQDLQDLLLELPAILEDQDTLPRSAHPSLLRRCLDLRARLNAWHENFTRNCPNPHYWLEFSALNIDPPVFPTRYQFSNVGVAHTCTFYWTNLIILYSTVIGLTPTSEAPLVTIDEIYDLGAQICMSMEYYISPGKKSYGPVLSMYPLRIAAECFKRMGEKGERSTLWCRAIFKILEEKGIVLARMLEKLARKSKESTEVVRAWQAKEWAGRGFWDRMEEGSAEGGDVVQRGRMEERMG